MHATNRPSNRPRTSTLRNKLDVIIILNVSLPTSYFWLHNWNRYPEDCFQIKFSHVQPSVVTKDKIPADIPLLIHTDVMVPKSRRGNTGYFRKEWKVLPPSLWCRVVAGGIQMRPAPARLRVKSFSAKVEEEKWHVEAIPNLFPRSKRWWGRRRRSISFPVFGGRSAINQSNLVKEC